MSWSDFLIILILCGTTMLICRTLPLLILRGKTLPGWLSNALTFIPPAAFSALIANDLFTLDLFSSNPYVSLIPIIAALVVIPFAIKTKSLVICIIVGVGTFGLLLLI